MKHARADYDRIQDPAGLIPGDMPVFLIIGKDAVAAETVRFWADRAEAIGAAPEIVAAARRQADLMDALSDHKIPDMPTTVC